MRACDDRGMSAPLVVVMGISGSGKSTVGIALAERLQVPFEDGDDLHPAHNVAKMSAGQPLTDADRRPWLDRVGEWLAAHPDGGVTACSALKRAYRDQFRQHAPAVVFLHLAGSREVIETRHAGRERHFMPTSLLSSQAQTLEPLAPDERGLTLDIEHSVPEIVASFVADLPPGPA